ncbi:MAG: serine/threonine protein kinase [Actinomycetota bacterium]|nr:serine/threonine protein kinase [Actinomycetota bacterium]
MTATVESTGIVLTPGSELLPGYQVVSLMRQGRRLDTWDVYSTERDCRCVVKTMRPDRRHETKPTEALLQEGRLLRHLTHPHLVRAYEVIEVPLAAIVLETLDGATLSAVVEDHSLDVGDAAQLGLQLVSVLSYLHRHDWLHLDVKPSNVIVSCGRARLIDLSLAARPGPGRRGAGTRGYLSPEQADGSPRGPAADVWGLGVTLGECLTGHLAYGEVCTWDGGRFRSPRLGWRFARRLNRLAPEFAALVLACVARSPADRPTLSNVRTTLTALA